MKQFSSVSEAFEWWLKHEYPNLSPDEKKGRLVQAWKDFTYNQGISEKRMVAILSEFGEINVKTIVTYKSK